METQTNSRRHGSSRPRSSAAVSRSAEPDAEVAAAPRTSTRPAVRASHSLGATLHKDSSPASSSSTQDTKSVASAVASKMSATLKSLPTPPFRFPIAPSFPKPWKSKQRPRSAGCHWTTSQGVVPRASSRSPPGARRTDVATPGEASNCLRPSSPERMPIFHDLACGLSFDVEVQGDTPSDITKEDLPSDELKEGQVNDDSVFELGFDFKGKNDKRNDAAEEAGQSDERTCYKPPRTSRKSRIVDDSVFECGFDFKGQDNKRNDVAEEAGQSDERMCYKPPRTSRKSRIVDDSVFECGFDFTGQDDKRNDAAEEAGQSDERTCYKSSRTSRKSRIVDDSVFECGFDFTGQDDKRNDVAEEAGQSDERTCYKPPRTSRKSRIVDDRAVAQGNNSSYATKSA